MLKITVDIINSGYKISGLINFQNKLKRLFANIDKNLNDIMKKKYLLKKELEEINIHHFNPIKAKF